MLSTNNRAGRKEALPHGRATELFAVLSCLLIGVMTVGTAMAQQSTQTKESSLARDSGRAVPVSDKPSVDGAALEEMLATIKRLEERVKELEEKLKQPDSENPETEKAVKAVAQDVADIQKENEKNRGFLSFFQGTEISGFVDAYYGYNFNRPDGDIQLRNFDTLHNQFSFNMAEIALEKQATPDDRLGFRMDLDFGPATQIVHSSEPGGLDTFNHLQQAYLSYLAPVGEGLQVDVGKFVTPHGAEVIETSGNWNYSRSLLFALAIPYYHFGVRATYPVSDKFSVSGFLVNGWNNVVDNNDRKSYGVQVAVKPDAKLSVTQSYMTGPEQFGNDEDYRHLWDTIVSYEVNPTLSLMTNYDYGLDRAAGARVYWQGIAAYARIQANRWLAFAPRFEWYDDHDGFTTGERQSLKDFTFTSEQKISNGLITRFEYRRDFSDKNFFIKPVDRLVKAQSGLSFGLVYAFSSKGEQ
ncbi:MAG: outer membrane beta-barrel protein [Blastocatellia bacterium]|nr:outer membrane beta-barrel protein [Blastocatellia bacterium]